MTRLAAILICLVFISSNPAIAGEVKSVTLEVKGMTCKLCPPMVKKALTDVKGVKKVDVSLEKKEAHVEYEDGVVKPEELIKTIDKAGFKASLSKEKK
ncbi:MAG: heavy metal-associated domain-containing protein [Deltaproteobacteria bacterium]|nr:heavy metal-associated domain-containing protein [Deltaproteobacteria bacterium]